jgi:ubiquinone/menaquinone biosynthesis C-methylase UbiE
VSAFDHLARILNLPAGYRLLREIVGGDALWRAYLEEYVKPEPGDKVLDIGCGPADVLRHLPQVDYTGLDYSASYIRSAQLRFGSRGRFWCADVSGVALEQERGTFSLALATGVIHHLNDQEAANLFGLARVALGPNGRLITFDGCYVPEQSRIARWFLAHDRGKFVRTRSEYERLASSAFSKVEGHLRHDLLRIPYTHLTMRCTN